MRVGFRACCSKPYIIFSHKLQKAEDGTMKLLSTVGVTLLSLFLLCGCANTTSHTKQLIPNKDDFSITKDESSPSATLAPHNEIDYNKLQISSLPFDTLLFLENDPLSVTGNISYSLKNATLFTNLYDAGFTIDHVGYPNDPIFPYRGSPHFDEIFDVNTGNFLPNIGLLRIDIKITNIDAWNVLSKRDYGNGYLFDIRKLYLADLSFSDENNCILCTHIATFDALNFCDENAFLYQLLPDEETIYSVGYFVYLDSLDAETVYLCNRSAFALTDEFDNVILIALTNNIKEIQNDSVPEK